MNIGVELKIRSNSNSKKPKGLPDRANTSHPKHAKRKIWCAAQDRRKDARRAAQEAAHARNVERGYSEWDLAKSKRAAIRAARRHA